MLSLRTLTAIAAVVATAGLVRTSGASTPPSHDVTVPTVDGATVVVEWTGTSPAGAAGADSACISGNTSLEDHHLITLTVPAGAYDNVVVAAHFHIDWVSAGVGPSDLVLTVEKDGTELDSSDGGTPQENVIFNNPGAGTYNAIVCSFASTAPTPYNGKLTLRAIAPEKIGNPPAGPGNATGAPPRFHLYAPDYPNQGFGMFGGEATVDVNWQSPLGSIFYLGFLETLRLRLDDATSPATETWEKMPTTASQKATSDPILVGDPDTGRIFALQLLFPEGQSAMDYSDDDGESWIPGMAGGFGSGADHQSMGVGPYPKTGPGSTIPHPAYPNAVYYCSQDITHVFCSRSDDGGVTFGPVVTAYTLNDCQGLHGHVKVAPDGTAYIPVAGCPSPLVNAAASRPAVVVSEDAGLTWQVRTVDTAPAGSGGGGPAGGGADPSVGIATDNTVYFAYAAEPDGRLHMVKSANRGVDWSNDIDISGMTGINTTTFPAVVAGDPQRAAVAFFGTTYNWLGDPGGQAFEGLWNLYVAATYDGGLTYHLVDLTPGDPIQKGGLCSGAFCRNLLDFFDAVIDPQGRVVVGYEDGCVGGCPLGMAGSFSDQVVIARQSGGRRMLAAFDPAEPALAGAPRIEGSRTADAAHIEWPAVDSGGAAVTGYKVYRGTTPGALSLVASVGMSRSYQDTGLDPATTYYYAATATNSQGESARGNELALAVGDNVPDFAAACNFPGRPMAIDLADESEAQPPSRDITAIHVAEPETDLGKIAFTLTFTEDAPPDQGNARFRVYFYVPKTGKFVVLNVRGGTRTYGYFSQDPNTGVHNTLFNEGDLDSATFAGGRLRMVIDKTKLGIETGDELLQVFADSQPGPVNSNVTREEAGYFEYTLIGNEFCYPVANAGPDFAVDEGQPATLSAAASTDPDNDTLTYSWAQTAGPDVTLSGADTATPSFTAPAVDSNTVLTFELTVQDNVASSVDSVDVTVVNAGDGNPQTGGLSNTRLGGALPALSLLALAGLLGLRGRRRRA